MRQSSPQLRKLTGTAGSRGEAQRPRPYKEAFDASILAQGAGVAAYSGCCFGMVALKAQALLLTSLYEVQH